MVRESPLLDLHTELGEKERTTAPTTPKTTPNKPTSKNKTSQKKKGPTKKPQNQTTQQQKQSHKAAWGSQAFLFFNPEEAAATLSQEQVENRAGVSLCQ